MDCRNIYNCERIQKRIENHSHYGPCFNGEVYRSFCSKREKFNKCKNCFEEVKNIEKEIIECNYNNINKGKELDNSKEITETEYENIKKKFENEEKTKKLEYDNKIQEIINSSQIKKTKSENDLKLLEQDISNLTKKIEKIELKFQKEIDCEKKKILNEIKNKYELELVKFKNEKKKEKERRIADMEIRKKNWESQKEIEINNMKNKALLVQNLIPILEKASLNNKI